MKETNRLLLPYAFTKKVAENSQESRPPAKIPASSPKPNLMLKSTPTMTMTTPSPSAIKAAAKSAALQVTKQITQEENDSDEEVAPENYFSLSDRSEPLAPALSPEAYAFSGVLVPDDLPPGTEPEPEPESQDAAANAPLEFKTTAPGSGSGSHGWLPKPGEDSSGQLYPHYPGYGDAGGSGAYYQVRGLTYGLTLRAWPRPWPVAFVLR